MLTRLKKNDLAKQMETQGKLDFVGTLVQRLSGKQECQTISCKCCQFEGKMYSFVVLLWAIFKDWFAV